MMTSSKVPSRKWCSSFSGCDVIIWVLSALATCCHGIILNGVVRLDVTEQRRVHYNAKVKCVGEIMNSTYPSDGHLYCDHIWDDIMCWDYTRAGTMATQKCPNYVNKFKVIANVTRVCDVDGTWKFYPKRNRTWTDYGACAYEGNQVLPSSQGFANHIPRIKFMYHIGFALSVTSLLLAIFIMVYFKKLHCARNTIHINLFLSFIVRAVCLILKDSMFIDGMGFSYDLYTDPEEKVLRFLPNATHWQCKLLITLTWYSMCTNLIWIFVEALYLYLLVFVAVFSERRNTACYVVFGWSASLSFILPWVMVRLHLEDDFCWHQNKEAGYVWIIQGPIVLVVMANFFIFLVTVWMLFTKLRASNTPEARKYRYRKLARSTLVLIPLFGIYYIFLVWLPVGTSIENSTFEIIYYYIHAFLDSYQGIAIAFLFCFMNGEVRAEVRKKCHCQWGGGGGGGLGPGATHSTWNTVSTYVSRARNSLHSLQSTAIDKLDMGNGGSYLHRGRNHSPPRTPPRDKVSNTVAIVTSGDEDERLMVVNKDEISFV